MPNRELKFIVLLRAWIVALYCGESLGIIPNAKGSSDG